jgi:hypothetical protein
MSPRKLTVCALATRLAKLQAAASRLCARLEPIAPPRTARQGKGAAWERLALAWRETSVAFWWVEEKVI